MLPQDLFNLTSQVGSIGKVGDAETAGGGRIIIISDSITIKGEGAKIQANARPTSDYTGIYGLQGGSAGYIYISTANNLNSNSLSNNFSIEAIGGFGYVDNFGGSGGVIVLDGNFTYPNIVANGGNAEREDGCGAAGTIYYKNQDLLIIDNNEFNTNQKQ